MAERIDEQPEIAITYFQPDIMKSGGSYVTSTSAAKKIDEYNRVVMMIDGTTIPIDEIVAIEGAIFETLNDQ
jgi:uncharacterized protein (UPF0248 family)